MQFLIRAYDGEGMLEKRMEVRPRHLEGMKALGKQIICAGGLLDEEAAMRLMAINTASMGGGEVNADLSAFLHHVRFVARASGQPLHSGLLHAAATSGHT